MINNAEIMKALECCTKGNTSNVCLVCPLRFSDICTEEENGLLKLALDLINRQKAEIEKLQDENKKEKLYNLRMTAHSVKTEAIKEFAERLKEELNNIARVKVDDYDYFCIGLGFIDSLVKEMVGDTE